MRCLICHEATLSKSVSISWDNAHQVVIVMSPDKDYEAKIKKEKNTIFESKCRTLTDRDRADIFPKGQQLLEIQSNVDSDVDCLPPL